MYRCKFCSSYHEFKARTKLDCFSNGASKRKDHTNRTSPGKDDPKQWVKSHG